MVAPQAPATRGFNCANCGAPIELRALLHTRAVACLSCAAILDPRDPNLMILQEAGRREGTTPRIPLGTRGTIEGHPFEVVGFQVRAIDVEGTKYTWDEYVLFNPYRGFRYISEYNGHWNVIRTLRMLPDTSGAGPEVQGTTYRHFQTSQAVTEFVLGEFPWRVRVGDTVEVRDHVAPPSMLSSEGTGEEVTWSIGEYTTGAEIWEMFGLPDEPPPSIGVFANEPSPFAGRTRPMWTTFLTLAALVLATFLWRVATAGREPIFAHRYDFNPAGTGEAAFVTEPFTVKAPGTLEIDIVTTVVNSWVYFDLALIDAERGTALNVGREVSFYSGVDADGSWTEGAQQDEVLLPSVPAGQYYLRVEPEGDRAAGRPVAYTIRLQRDVLSMLPYGIALVLLVIPPIVVTMRAAAFEGQRWQESDHAPGGGSGDDDDDDAGDD